MVIHHLYKTWRALLNLPYCQWVLSKMPGRRVHLRFFKKFNTCELFCKSPCHVEPISSIFNMLNFYATEKFQPFWLDLMAEHSLTLHLDSATSKTWSYVVWQVWYPSQQRLSKPKWPLQCKEWYHGTQWISKTAYVMHVEHYYSDSTDKIQVFFSPEGIPHWLTLSIY